MIQNFNDWRNRYDSLTFQEQVEYHNHLESLYPNQAHYDLNAFQKVLEISKPKTIIEAGVWKANLADIILRENKDIESWRGIEISSSAIEKTACKDFRFTYAEINSFDWWKKLDLSSDLFFATHFIEHISNKHFEQLVNAIKSPYVYFEAPLSDQGDEWDVFLGTHKLNIGWDGVKKIMKNYQEIEITPICKLYYK